MTVTLDQAKAHCRVTWAEEDELIQSYLDSAVAWLERFTGLPGLIEEGGTTIPAELDQATRMLVAWWFDNRDAANAAQLAEVPFGIQSLAGPFRLPTVI
jgi:hypothetical protein